MPAETSSWKPQFECFAAADAYSVDKRGRARLATRAVSTRVDLKALLGLAWPVVIARSSQAVIGFCDALMTAPLGENSLAAVTTGSMNVFTVVILPMGLVFIAQSFAAQLEGKKRLDAAVRYAWYALILAGLSMAVGLLLVPVIPSVLGTVGYEAEVLSLMTTYLQIRMLSVGPAVGIEALGNWYGGLGNTRLHMIAGLVAMVFNVFLNWVLIGGNLGAPALGVTGAALASIIATWIAFCALAFMFAMKVGLDRIESVRPRGLMAAELTRMVRFGLPHGINWFLEFAAFALFINVVVRDLGTTVLAAMMVVFNINSVSFMPAFGIATAGSILSGQAIGRDEKDSVKSILWLTMRVAVVWQCTIGVAYILFPSTLMAWFSSEGSSPELVTIGAVLLALSAAWQLFDAAAITLGETLRSAGDTAWTLYARLTIAWLVFVPASYVGVKMLDGGHVAAMLCIIGYLALLAIVLAWRFWTGAWRNIDLTGDESGLLDIAPS